MATMLDQYAVMGNPIAHSKSPHIHALFAAQTGQSLEYRAIRVEPGGFAAAARAFRAAGGKGLNVTVPFKPDAWVFADLLSARAERAGAVNTLIFDSTGVRGDNTDGPGLVRDLTVNHGYALAGRRILLLGAGGAARGVLQPLLLEQPAQLVIANRTAGKALELSLRFGDLGRVSGCGFAELAGRQFDLIINATSAGLSDAVPLLPEGVLAADGWCYDLMYRSEPTAFVRWGKEQGAARSLDGWGMLVEQAAQSFYLWRGIWPETRPVIENCR
ncbi:shikimate dehydrogenase [Candidatus Contendibacter odensensis]|uniref:Shikimate dehydrogenase (NADP(+)) n=1 Tax=Candidatus Contendobacter odensis Run_B_J11 TaxID=1400861 RepID=A0A7U7J692_9GAMM|nr:dehydroshikimate reductase, NAD(P)-binding [Candidatus Contendobacter odensis Run_B_J11]